MLQKWWSHKLLAVVKDRVSMYLFYREAEQLSVLAKSSLKAPNHLNAMLIMQQVTTPDDISVAEGFLRERGSPIDVAALA